MMPDDTDDLIMRAADGSLDAADADRLLAACRRDPAALDALALHVTLDRLLHAVESDPDGRSVAREFAMRVEQRRADAMRDARFPQHASQHIRRSLFLRWLGAAAAALALLAGVVFLAGKKSPAGHPIASDARPAAMAKLLSTVNARWADDGTELSLNAGDEPAGMLRLVEGTAEFLTSRGASVVMQGPTAMRFESPALITVESGKVVCRCPTPASRLTVRTSETQVIDLGTEFAVEARADKSTRVAVFSGEVQVGADVSPTVLHQGQAAEVRSLGVTMLEATAAERMVTRLDDGASAAGTTNRLRHPAFDSPQPGGWELTEHHASIEGAAVRVSSRGHRFWPSARQKIWQADLSGRAVMASVRAMQPEDDPLQPMQFAVLKLVFLGERGVQFAYASRHFQFGGEQAGIFQNAQVAAIAPPGTKGVSVELLLNARGEKRGSVIFEDAVLAIGESPAKPRPQPR